MRTNARLADIIINPIFNNLAPYIKGLDLEPHRRSAHNRCVCFLESHTNDLLEGIKIELQPLNEIIEAVRLFKFYTDAYEAGDVKTLEIADGAKANLFKLLSSVEESLDKSGF